MNMTANRVALVTGVSSGIRRETAQLLPEHDARTFGTVIYLRRASTAFLADGFSSMEQLVPGFLPNKAVKKDRQSSYSLNRERKL